MTRHDESTPNMKYSFSAVRRWDAIPDAGRASQSKEDTHEKKHDGSRRPRHLHDPRILRGGAAPAGSLCHPASRGATVPLDPMSRAPISSAAKPSRTGSRSIRSIYVGEPVADDFGLVRLEGEISTSGEDQVDHRQVGRFPVWQPRRQSGCLWLFMFNAFFNLVKQGPVIPYIGGGVGFAAMHINDTFGNDTQGEARNGCCSIPTMTIRSLPIRRGAGLEFVLNRRLSLDFGYRYFGTSNANFNSSDSPIQTETKFESHNALAGIRVKFSISGGASGDKKRGGDFPASFGDTLASCRLT